MRPSLAGPILGLLALAAPCLGGEPDPSTYWNINDLRPGMKGVGKTVMVGTKLEEFRAEVLGVMRDVSPGRDMVLCRLSGCNLEHAGIIQGMSGSPITIDGKLVGAVAFAWEFGKDPIAGVTPFSQMVQYVRANARRVAAGDGGVRTASLDPAAILNRETAPPLALDPAPTVAGMRAIAMPIAASGFTPRALSLLAERLAPLGMAPMAGGRAADEIVQAEGDKPLVPGAPLSVAMVTGDFDISGIGTVTHVEGDRVYGFGHPMLSLGSCAMPMMTGYIHTVYPRASVSMKLGSPLKTVGVLDTDVSTAVAGRLGAVPDMMPMSVTVKVGRFSEPRTYRVQVVREPNLLANLVLTVLANAVDTEGNLPEELTGKVSSAITIEGHPPLRTEDTFSGPRYAGPLGPSALFGAIASDVGLLTRNGLTPARIESIDCKVEIAAGRTTAELTSVRLASDRVEPGSTLRVIATLKPHLAPPRAVELALPIPVDFPEGTHEVFVCDAGQSLRRRFRNEPHLTEPRDLDGVLGILRLRAEPIRTHLYLHVPRPDRGLAVEGQALPNLPSSARAVIATGRQSAPPVVRTDLVAEGETPWVVEGLQTLKFTAVRDTGVAGDSK